MEPTVNINEVLSALETLYNGKNPEEKEKASRWLMELQKSLNAWQIADHLLHLNRDEETSYFAAQTLRTKIQFSFHELPPDNFEALSASLMGHCRNITNNTKHTIVTQLSLALSDLALKVGSWKNAIATLLKDFSAKEDQWCFLLEILHVYPEEINSRHLKLGENRRNEVYNELRQSSHEFIFFLSKVAENRSSDLKILCQILRCLCSWMSVYAVEEALLVEQPLLNMAFSALSSHNCNPELHKEASDCISAAFTTVEDLTTKASLAQYLVTQTEKLIPALQLSLQNNHSEQSLNLSRVFTEMSESLLEAMIHTPNQNFGDFKVLHLLLVCIDCNDFKVADITFNFWNHLSDSLYEIKDKQLNLQFRPYVHRLVLSLAKLCGRSCQHEPEDEDDKDDDFEQFRTNSQDLVRDILFVSDPDQLLTEMNQMLVTSVHSGQEDGSTFIEGILFIMQMVVKKINSQNIEMVSQLLNMISSLLSSKHLHLISTSLLLIGSLQNWFKDNPSFIEPLMPPILICFQNSKTALPAAQCLNLLCQSLPNQILSNLPTLLNLLDHCEKIKLKQLGILKLLEAVCNMMSCLPIGKVVEGLGHLCISPVSSITKIIEDPLVKVDEESCQKILLPLDKLSAIFKYVQVPVPQDQQSPCFQVFTQTWPVLSKLLEKFSVDNRVVEHCCRCLRNATRSYGKNNGSLIMPIMTKMLEIYKLYPHSCCLYMGSILVDSYASDSQNQPFFLSLLNEFSIQTFSYIEKPEGMLNYPDIVDDFFRLTLRLVEKCPIPFLEFGGCQMIVNSGILCLSISHQEANATVVRFFLSLIELATQPKQVIENGERLHSLLLQLFTNIGKNLVNGVIDACLLRVPVRLISYLASINTELLKLDKNETKKWLEEAVNNLPKEVGGGVAAVTETQKKNFIHNITSTFDEDEIAELYEDFSMLFK